MNRCALMLFVCFTISPQKRNARRSPAKCRDLLEFCRLPRKSTEPKRKPGNVEKKKNVARHEASGRSHAVDPFVNMVPASASFPSLPYSMRYAASPLAVADSKRDPIYRCGGPPPPTPHQHLCFKSSGAPFFVLFFNFLPFWFTENHLLP